jgi:hypothetical protein
MLSKNNPFEIYLSNEKIKILEQLAHKENKSIEQIIEEIIVKSLLN